MDVVHLSLQVPPSTFDTSSAPRTSNMDAVTGQLTTITSQVSQQVATIAAPVTGKIVANPAYAAATAFYVSKQPYLDQITFDEWSAIAVTVVPALFLVAHMLWSLLCCCNSQPAKVAPAPVPLPKKGDKPPQPKGPPPRGSPPKASPPPKGKASPPPKGKNGKSLVA